MGVALNSLVKGSMTYTKTSSSQILTKHWLPCWSRKVIAFIAESVEWMGTRFFDGIVTVHRLYKTLFLTNHIGPELPYSGELAQSGSKNYSDRPLSLCIYWGVTAIRGIREMVKALEYIEIPHNSPLVGISALKVYCGLNLMGMKKVQYEGFVNRNEIAELLGGSKSRACFISSCA